MGLYLLFIIPPLILSLYAQFKVNATFKKYANVRSASGYTGRDVAQTLLRNNGISQVKVEPIGGSLTDHYDPRSHTLRLSETVYGSNSIAAIGVAAHEAGHAIQHQQQYGPLELRHSIVPVANFASSAAFPILLIGMFFGSTALGLKMILLGIILFSAVVLFHVVTLPVEFNASRRAVAQLSSTGLISSEEAPLVKKVLGAAALTYLAAALSAIANLMYYILIFMGSSDE